ncbi:hypothetical protein ABFS82_08G111500 [Erythranthe guttata]|uniref:uncharacterized protein LOC105970619 n=1 Tax=Erythranthe guttata TaxID=4155 RepID=UPI00064D8946|nr:PREDICTED: uncharacterized protein LOC105970619 [Erythranthe guttata]|eukprot:XP_012850905.1 PREDICTED: uncharacterized protein LOC105970619 [Erythranthe guttata]
MSVVQFPEAMDSSSADVQIWNNAAFDNGGISEDFTGSRQSWGSLKSVFANPKSSFDSVSDKENRNDVLENQISSVSVSSSLNKSSNATPFKPVNADRAAEKSRIKRGLVDEDVVLKLKIRDEKKIDEEIEEVESEICRLSSRLEALRLEKIKRTVKAVEKRGGRVVQAKFMEQKQSAKNEEISVPCLSSARTKVQRRGISLGPAEILSAGGGGRRGMSMGPTEIFGATKSRQDTMIKTTPLQSRRKSCFFKLQEIDEEKAVLRKERCSLSPKSRKLAAKTPSRQAVTTISSRKNLKKEDAVISSIHPKKLFKDGEKSVPPTNKKPLIRPGRVVPSRYNQSTTTTNGNQSASVVMRKRSLPENDLEQGKRDEKKRSLSGDDANEKKINLGTESRVKKRWEINPSEIVVHGSTSAVEADYLPELLPRIRIGRCKNESPRDSGPAKKVVELIGKKSFFGSDEETDIASVCQALSFYGEGEDEDEE